MTHRRILAIDYGSKRIGLAASDPLGITAMPLPFLPHKNWTQALNDLRKIVQDKSIALVIVGLPKAPDGGEGAQAKSCRDFGEKLAATLRVPVEMVDETMTSREAGDILINEFNLSRGKRKGVIDSLSACLMLRSYLERI